MRKLTLEQARNQYPHRFTLEHCPQWARKPHYNETTHEFVGYYRPHYRTDKEWFENTFFHGEPGLVGDDGKHCQSFNQSWPIGAGFSPMPCVRGQA
jgi:hypothetical protein